MHEISSQTGLSTRSVGRILKENNFDPYVARQVQTFLVHDNESRLSFCTWFLNQPDLIHWTIFSDECLFYLNGSSCNNYYWAAGNPRIIQESKSQYDPRVMAWAGIWNTRITGPFFFEGTVTGNSFSFL